MSYSKGYEEDILMPVFTTLYNEYEHTNNICQFCEDYRQDNVATRFLLVRSLDKSNLKDIITMYSNDNTCGNMRVLTEKAYHSAVTIEQLIDYIISKRPELIEQREHELERLPEVLADFPVVSCGVRNDKVDDIVKAFVRNKSLKTMDALFDELDNSVLPRIRQYSLWSYYNQTSNDIIELFFLKHTSVIPTLRKIHDIDFFIKIGNDIVPFDLKFTHISDSYFDLASQGIIRDVSPMTHDDFYIDPASESSEIKVIKAYYSAFKRAHRDLGLPNLSGLEKNDLCNLLLQTGDNEAKNFVIEMQRNHSAFVPATPEQLYPLEWWNYKYQGERLFCNNNRLFVFLAYANKFVDGRELKGKTAEIGRKITSLLNNLTMNDIHTVKYRYDKEVSLAGDYSALSLSTIYSE